MSKARDLADSVSTGGILEDGAVSVSEISDLTVTAEELNNVAGVNSDVQTQLDLKAPLASPTFSGNVGIGTNSPSEELSTVGNVNIGNNDSSNPASYLRFGATLYGAADIRPSDEGAHKVGLDFYTDGTGDATVNPTFAMRIDNSGNVGIGTDSPQTNLHIYDTATGGEGSIYLGGTSSAATGHLFYEISGATYLSLKNTYRSTTANAYTVYDSGYHKFLTGTGGTEAFRFGTSGELGIGGTNYGTSGQVLTSGGSGAAPTWADAAGGGAAFSAF